MRGTWTTNSYADFAWKTSYLYRLYDGDDALLYVGVSVNPEMRIARHRGRQPWGDVIANWVVEPQASREAALAAERSAIHHERPLRNVNRPRMECC